MKSLFEKVVTKKLEDKVITYDLKKIITTTYEKI